MSFNTNQKFLNALYYKVWHLLFGWQRILLAVCQMCVNVFCVHGVCSRNQLFYKRMENNRFYNLYIKIWSFFWQVSPHQSVSRQLSSSMNSKTVLVSVTAVFLPAADPGWSWWCTWRRVASNSKHWRRQTGPQPPGWDGRRPTSSALCPPHSWTKAQANTS